MRWGAFLLSIVALAGGCSSTHSVDKHSTHNQLRVYRQAPSSALVFSPPVAQNEPELDLEREGRAPEAFMGFESVSATYFWIRTDDRQLDFGGFHNDHNFDRYERRAVSTRVGAVYR